MRVAVPTGVDAMADRSSVLVFSAHAADFVWRAGGTIALYASRGHRVRILCLSFGERGESQGAWKEPGMTVERVKEIRRAESERAASHSRRGGAVLRCRRLSAARDRQPRRRAGTGVPHVPAGGRSDPLLQRSLQSGSSGSESDLAPDARLRAGRRLPAPRSRRSARRRCSCSNRISRSSAISSQMCCST